MNRISIHRFWASLICCGTIFMAWQGAFSVEPPKSFKAPSVSRGEVLPPAPLPEPLKATPSPSVREDRYSQPDINVTGHHQHQHQQGKCPLCKNDPKTPCGECKMCVAGFPCEYTFCRHCVLMRSKNMGNSCDLGGGGEPCGSCDLCREHRSDPCEHADDGYERSGAYNPNQEPKLGAVLPRPIVDFFNNGARKFPVYYNPAPYVRSNANPSLFVGYKRPYTSRWSCSLCYKDPCRCTLPGFAGQVPFAYSCKFCNRNPCACVEEICNVNKEMNPKGVSNALVQSKAISANTPEGEALRRKAQETPQTTQRAPGKEPARSPSAPPQSKAADIFDDMVPPKPGTKTSLLDEFENEDTQPAAPRQTPSRPPLDRPAPTNTEPRGAVEPMI